jgi:exodeoxyribonuclease VII small subunit
VTQPPAQPAPSDANLSFEEALSRLEQLIARIESGEVGLEKAIAEYERGVTLIRRCKDILQKAEQRVDELTRQSAPTPPPTPTD